MADSIRVLLVDDDPDVLELVATYLARENERIQPVTESSPEDCLERCRVNRVDCIVSDYDMPDLNGIQLLRTVRREYPELPFILYTGKGSEEIASEAISAGVTDYLQKSTGTSQYQVLANRITNAVEQYRSRKRVIETEEMLSQIAETTEDILFMFDSDWTELLFINSAYEEVWDRAIDELEADPRSFLENIHPDDRQKAKAGLQTVLDGEELEIEYRILIRDGEVRWIYGDARPVFDDDGEFVRIVGSVRDITDQRALTRD